MFKSYTYGKKKKNFDVQTQPKSLTTRSRIFQRRRQLVRDSAKGSRSTASIIPSSNIESKTVSTTFDQFFSLTSSGLQIGNLLIAFMCSANLHLRLGLIQSLGAGSQSFVSRRASVYYAPVSGFGSVIKHIGPEINLRRCDSRDSVHPVVAAIDEDFGDVSFSLEDYGVYEGSSGYVVSSSEGEDSDGDAFLTPFAETDLPLSKERLETPNAALTLSAHRLATIQKGYRKNRTRRGVILTLGLTAVMVLLLLFVDWCSWRIVRLPLEPFYLTYPFAIAVFLSACIGFLFVAVVDGLKIHQFIKRERSHNSLKTSIPTIGGLFFLPVGIITWRAIIGHHSIFAIGVAAATLGFAAIGLLDDIYRFTKNYNHQLPRWLKLLLQVLSSLLRNLKFGK